MKLKPCPFCGGAACEPQPYGNFERDEMGNVIDHGKFIDCSLCGASVWRRVPGADDVTLTTAWNNRPNAVKRQLESALAVPPGEMTKDWLEANYRETEYRIRQALELLNRE